MSQYGEYASMGRVEETTVGVALALGRAVASQVHNLHVL